MDFIAALGDKETLLGFRLAGLTHVVEANEQTADAKMNGLLNEPNAGIVVVAQDFVKFMSPKTQKRMDASTKPVVVVVPAKGGRVSEEAKIANMIKRAIGVDLTKK